MKREDVLKGKNYGLFLIVLDKDGEIDKNIFYKSYYSTDEIVNSIVDDKDLQDIMVKYNVNEVHVIYLDEEVKKDKDFNKIEEEYL